MMSHPEQESEKLMVYGGLTSNDGDGDGDGDGGDGGDDDEENLRDLSTLCEMKGHTSHIIGVTCNPIADLDSGASEQTAVSIEENGIHLWDLGASSATETASCLDSKEPLRAGCWDPHHLENFVTVQGTSVCVRDLRTLGKSSDGRLTISDAHRDTITSVDYNPNKPFHIVTAGKDRQSRIFDLRKPECALKVLGGHSHWVYTASYNRFHDQLLLTSGSDSIVNLWSVVSVSSAPLGELEDPQNEKEGDKLVGAYDSHEDSVMGHAWSCYDAWVFASLSYDGRVVVNHVPSTEKYKILL